VKPREKRKYPHGTGRVYLSATLAALSVILAVLLLQSSLYFLVYYALVSAAMTTILFVLKIRFPGRLTSTQAQESSNTDSFQPEERTTSWKTLSAVFLILLSALLIPLSLALILPADVWVILITSLTSSVSFAEIFYYLYCRQSEGGTLK
jgi:hypothetical protein